MMEVQVSEQTHAILLETVASGGYASPAEAIEDALRMLRSWQDLRATRMQAAVQLGIEQLDRGEYLPWTEVRTLLRERVEAKKRAIES